MDAMFPLNMSPMLREAAALKVDELLRVKEEVKRRYDRKSRQVAERDHVKRVTALLNDIKNINPEIMREDDLGFMSYYIEQAQEDRSVSISKVLAFEKQLFRKVEQYLNRIEVSLFHVALMQESTDADKIMSSMVAELQTVDLHEDFEVVETELEEVLEKFVQETFSTIPVDVEAIESFLQSRFITKDDERKLYNIRSGLLEHGEEIENHGLDIDQDHLIRTIKQIVLKNDAISSEMKMKLKGYLLSPVMIGELLSAINTRSIKNWRYKDADKGLLVTARQSPEGDYSIAVEEDIVDMLFLHCMGMSWAAVLKDCLVHFARSCDSFVCQAVIPDEQKKVDYFLSDFTPPPKPPKSPELCANCRQSKGCLDIPPPPPPDMFGFPCPPPPPPPPGFYNHLPIKKKKNRCPVPFIPPPPVVIVVTQTLDNDRKNIYIKEFFMSRLPVQAKHAPKHASGEVVQAKLMKTLATDLKLGEAFDRKLQTSSVKFESLTSTLPHQTILAVLKFLGVHESCLNFFSRFVKSRLNIGSAICGAPDRVLPRLSGVPNDHALELFFTEAIFFFLELAVRQITGNYLYRLKDTCYFIGTAEQQGQWREVLHSFSNVMGLKFTSQQDLKIGLLHIDANSASVDEEGVDAYARTVKKQLSKCCTMLDWVRVWNNTAGSYAEHLFGPLATVFGKDQLEAVKRAYNRIFDIIFDGGNVTEHVKKLLATHTKLVLSDPPFSLEAMIHLPQAYGGLGVKNPFISFKVAGKLKEDPEELIKSHFAVEDAYFTQAAENFARFERDVLTQKLEFVFGSDQTVIAAALGEDYDLAKFPSRDEFTRLRGRTNFPSIRPSKDNCFDPYLSYPSISQLQDKLLSEPKVEADFSDEVSDEISRLSGTGDMVRARHLGRQEKWILQLFADECFELYGGLELWCGSNVPQRVLKAVRGQVWSELEDDSSSGYDSVSTMSEV